jgi:hypothetical protein
MPFPIIGAVAAAAGIGMSLWGASEQEDQQKKAARAAAAAARQQKKFADAQNKIINQTIKPLIKKQGEMQEKASEESRKAVELQRTQMRLDAARTQRDIMRQRIRLAATSLARANAQGAGGLGRESSSYFGSLNQITSETNRANLGLRQNVSIGESLFDTNIAMSEFISEANRAGTEINLAQADIQTIQNKAAAAAGVANARIAGINTGPNWQQTLGAGILQNIGTIDALGTSALFGGGTTNVGGFSSPSNGYFYDLTPGELARFEGF